MAVLTPLWTACDPQKSQWGFDAIDTMVTPPDDVNLGCGVTVPAAGLTSERAACEFGSGSHAFESLGTDPSVFAAVPIRHVIIMMKENRSFDELLGRLHEHNRPDVEAVPSTYFNPNLQGTPIYPFHADTTCYPYDPLHQSSSVMAAIDHDKMDGFVINAANSTGTDGSFVMAYYDNTDLPFYYWLANTFAVSDRHFAPMASGTFGNRDFMMFGTSVGVVDTGIVFPPATTPSILQLLMNAKYTWGAYTDGSPFSGSLDWVRPAADGGAATTPDPGVHTLQDLYDALDKGTLPNVAFVDGLDNVEDDHPDADLANGERWVKKIYDHAITSPQWQRLAIIWTYDEAGAFADHVPPEPAACPPLPSTAPFTELGPRIPLVVISPWAKRSYASHVIHDHTAIIRFIEAIFNLPALTARDANSDALFDMFDFSCGRDLTVGPAPEAGIGVCTHPAPPGTD